MGEVNFPPVPHWANWIGLLFTVVVPFFFIVMWIWQRWLSGWWALRSQSAAEEEAQYIAKQIASSFWFQENTSAIICRVALWLSICIVMSFIFLLNHHLQPSVNEIFSKINFVPLLKRDNSLYLRIFYIFIIFFYISAPFSIGIMYFGRYINPQKYRRRLKYKLLRAIRKFGLPGQHANQIASYLIQNKLKSMRKDI